MTRLYRPHIPLATKIAVAERQAKEYPCLLWGHYLVVDWTGNQRRQLESLLSILAKAFGCEIKELRLDHDPPLGARPLMHKRKTGTVVYSPDANDPEHLFYRPHGTIHANSHDVKTRIRGDHGQFPDVTLIKRERRRQRRLKPTPAQKKVERLKEQKRARDKALRRKIKEERKARCRK
jgi:hypothetical protein